MDTVPLCLSLKIHLQNPFNNPSSIGKNKTRARDFGIDTAKAKKWGKKEYSSLKHQLKQEEKNHIKEYTKNASPLNSYLRENDGELGSDKIKNKKIEIIDNALKKIKLKESIIVYRGTDGIIFGEEFQKTLMNGNKVNQNVAKKIMKQFEGTALLERGYLSTSIALANQFIARPVLLELKVPKNSEACYVDPISYYPGQYELLIARNTQYHIDDIRVIANGGSSKLKVTAHLMI
ncbi:ADP-ribosyltransferase [Bacillus thuringiensis]|uniref:ADP-ribosyltransferase n=1 Tax=Bacillus thuringiensis TaxID=1428 RepID=A0A9X6Y830_BACTU|nr:ADP-ribosyltransferase [Bacillus thuringiensis]PEA86926.1 ADP-ribosyltransferase [Bacillus thuringiensis]